MTDRRFQLGGPGRDPIGPTADTRVNSPIGPVTGPANRARPAPVPPAGSAERCRPQQNCADAGATGR